MQGGQALLFLSQLVKMFRTGIIISPEKAILKMTFLFQRWDVSSLEGNDVMTDSIVVIQRFFFQPDLWSFNSKLVLFEENKAKSFHHPGI